MQKYVTFPVYKSSEIKNWHLKHTVNPVLSGHSQIDKTQILMACGSLMKVESIAECPLEHSAILLTYIKR